MATVVEVKVPGTSIAAPKQGESLKIWEVRVLAKGCIKLEVQRAKQILENRKRLEELNVLAAVDVVRQSM
jgi:hypothetical protein